MEHNEVKEAISQILSSSSSYFQPLLDVLSDFLANKVKEYYRQSKELGDASVEEVAAVAIEGLVEHLAQVTEELVPEVSEQHALYEPKGEEASEESNEGPKSDNDLKEIAWEIQEGMGWCDEGYLLNLGLTNEEIEKMKEKGWLTDITDDSAAQERLGVGDELGGEEPEGAVFKVDVDPMSEGEDPFAE